MKTGKTGTNHSNASFVCRELVGIDFSGSNCEWTDFSGANLTGANFTNANLKGADFTDADITGTIFDGACAYGALPLKLVLKGARR